MHTLQSCCDGFRARQFAEAHYKQPWPRRHLKGNFPMAFQMWKPSRSRSPWSCLVPLASYTPLIRLSSCVPLCLHVETQGCAGDDPQLRSKHVQSANPVDQKGILVVVTAISGKMEMTGFEQITKQARARYAGWHNQLSKQADAMPLCCSLYKRPCIALRITFACIHEVCPVTYRLNILTAVCGGEKGVQQVLTCFSQRYQGQWLALSDGVGGAIGQHRLAAQSLHASKSEVRRNQEHI